MISFQWAKLGHGLKNKVNNFSQCINLVEHLKYAVSLNQLATFKSDISVDKLYPDSDSDFLRSTVSSSSAKSNAEQFSGYIPTDELEITRSKSSGPGGQNVNKVNSKVEIRFHLNSASWIPDWLKPRIAAQEDHRITKDGFLIIKSDMTRKQMLNQADCMNKLRKIIFSASVIQREPTEEEVKLKESRIAKAKAQVLREKRNRSMLKRSRSNPEF